MEFTKQQRHEIYKKALEYHLNDTPPYSMCAMVVRAVRNISNTRIWFPVIMQEFKELTSLKPNDVGACYFWWDASDKDIRTKYFKQLIDETK